MVECGSLVSGPRICHSLAHKVVKGEDAWTQLPDLEWSENDKKIGYGVFGVFDGHGNKEAAKFVSKHILEEIRSALLSKEAKAVSEKTTTAPSDYAMFNVSEGEERFGEWALQDAVLARLPKALCGAFAETDRKFRETNNDSGTTATVVALVGWGVVIANVGDSLAYLDTGSEVVRVSSNHRIADSKEERERITKAGGSIARAAIDGIAAGPLRAWPGGLAMGRTIGDPKAGNFVCAEPEVRQIAWPLSGGRLIVASDGLWDAVNAKSACHSVRGLSSGQAASHLAKLAQKGKSSRDDVTVVVVDALPHHQGKVPVCLAKTSSGLTASLSRTLSSLSNISNASGSIDIGNENVNVWRPLEDPGSKWQEAIRDRRVGMLQQIKWAEEEKAAEARLLTQQSLEIQGTVNASESCVIVDNHEKFDDVFYEGLEEEKEEEWHSVENHRKSRQNERLVQNRRNVRGHRRSASDVRYRDSQSGGYQNPPRSRTFSEDLSQPGDGTHGKPIIIKSGNNIIEVSMNVESDWDPAVHKRSDCSPLGGEGAKNGPGGKRGSSTRRGRGQNQRGRRNPWNGSRNSFSSGDYSVTNRGGHRRTSSDGEYRGRYRGRGRYSSRGHRGRGWRGGFQGASVENVVT